MNRELIDKRIDACLDEIYMASESVSDDLTGVPFSEISRAIGIMGTFNSILGNAFYLDQKTQQAICDKYTKGLRGMWFYPKKLNTWMDHECKISNDIEANTDIRCRSEVFDIAHKMKHKETDEKELRNYIESLNLPQNIKERVDKHIDSMVKSFAIDDDFDEYIKEREALYNDKSLSGKEKTKKAKEIALRHGCVWRIRDKERLQFNVFNYSPSNHKPHFDKMKEYYDAARLQSNINNIDSVVGQMCLENNERNPNYIIDFVHEIMALSAVVKKNKEEQHD